jgi:hypothetical protein
VSTIARAWILLAVGAALRDCALLGAAVLLLCAHQHDRLDGAPDRAHAWLRCLLGGALLCVAGGLLAAHTGSVFFGWWPVSDPGLPLPGWLLAPLVALGGLAWREVSALHAAAALGVLGALLAAQQGAAWAPCAFAALAAAIAVANGARHLGPIARGLALPHHEQ